MPNLLKIKAKFTPEIDPGFVPAPLWNKAYRELAASTPGAAPLAIGLSRPDGTASVFRTVSLPHHGEHAALNVTYVERIVKFLLWARGGNKVYLSGPNAEGIAAELRRIYSDKGERAFDVDFTRKLFQTEIDFLVVAEKDLPKESTSHLPLGRNLDGVRIGFDLGGSDRKCALLVDGKVVFSEEVKWDPYFQKDPSYQFDGIMHSLKIAAEHCPPGRKVQAIGGSSAGVYINNEIGPASLFRGITDPKVYAEVVRPMFKRVQKEWGGIPLEVINDGDVTALAASMSLEVNGVLGIAMGTSVAAGYVDTQGRMTNWLSELAFVPFDYRDQGPADEWSGDRGCGVQYFSQQGVGRLLPLAGIQLPDEMRLPEKLEELQKLMKEGDARAVKVYEAIGVCFGYYLAHLAEFYDYEHLLIMGRVTTGKGGDIIIDKARQVLKVEFPALDIKLTVPDEKSKRHGQAVAAASLPKIG
ncbi:MAG: hypothetical protein RL095_3063 [Verrucomicrobiota bacterium]|jgi:predicted NBD/HSP70 family sugar kinase